MRTRYAAVYNLLALSVVFMFHLKPPSIFSIPPLELYATFSSLSSIVYFLADLMHVSPPSPHPPIYPSFSLHSPPPPSLPCLMRKGGRKELIRLERKVQSGAEQSRAWCLAARRQRIKNSSALQTRSLAVDFQGGFVHRISASVLRAARGSHAETAVVGQSWSLPRHNFLTGLECLTWRERMRCTAQRSELF